jgi:hypothetical protein
MLMGYRDQKEGVGVLFERGNRISKGRLRRMRHLWWSEIDTGRRAKAAKMPSKL